MIKRICLFSGVILAGAGCAGSTNDGDNLNEVSVTVEIDGEEVETETTVLCRDDCEIDFRGTPVPPEDYNSKAPVHETVPGAIMEISYNSEPDIVSFAGFSHEESVEYLVLHDDTISLTEVTGTRDYAIYLGWFEGENEDNLRSVVETAFTVEVMEDS